MPAIARYLSPRIAAVHETAKRDHADFRILSGQFGLLAAEDPIPWYDHLMRPDEVASMAEKIARQMDEFSDVSFFIVASDYLVPYLAAITEACRAIGIKLHVIEMERA